MSKGEETVALENGKVVKHLGPGFMKLKVAMCSGVAPP